MNANAVKLRTVAELAGVVLDGFKLRDLWSTLAGQPPTQRYVTEYIELIEAEQ